MHKLVPEDGAGGIVLWSAIAYNPHMLKRWLASAGCAALVASMSGVLASCAAYGPQTELTSSGQGSYAFKSKPADPSERTSAPNGAEPGSPEVARRTRLVGEEQMVIPGNGGGAGSMWIPKPEKTTAP